MEVKHTPETEITEGNKLIAEFMGMREETQGDITYINIPKIVNIQKVKGEETKFQELGFHASWNWLMAVVKKLKAYDIKEEFESEDYIDAFMRNYEEVIFSLGTLNIETTWNRVIGLIKLINYYESLITKATK